VRLIRALDPSDVRHRQQSGHEQHPSSHPIIGAHVLSTSRALPPNIQPGPGSHGLSGASQYPSSQYDSVKVEEDYVVGSRTFLFIFYFLMSEMVVCFASHRRRNRPIAFHIHQSTRLTTHTQPS
jgi:hypothetical protein